MSTYIPYVSNSNTVSLNFSWTGKSLSEKNPPASYLFFSPFNKMLYLVWLCVQFHCGRRCCFLITLPPRRNKQLIRQNQGLWLVINERFKVLFFISFLSVFASFLTFSPEREEKFHGSDSRFSTARTLLLFRESMSPRPFPRKIHLNSILDRKLSLSGYSAVHHSHTYAHPVRHLF